ncbi:hypothetical protein FRC17_000507, partial [Serendipita sp. 399]
MTVYFLELDLDSSTATAPFSQFEYSKLLSLSTQKAAVLVMSSKEKRYSRQKLSVVTTPKKEEEADATARKKVRSAKATDASTNALLSPKQPTPFVPPRSAASLWTVDNVMFQPSSLSTPEGIEIASQLLLDMLYGAQRRGKVDNPTTTHETNETHDIVQSDNSASAAVSITVLNEATTQFLARFQPWTLPLLLSYNAELNELFLRTVINCFPTTADEYVSSSASASALLDAYRSLYVPLEHTQRVEGAAFDDEFSKGHDKSFQFESALRCLSKLEFPIIPISPKVTSPISTRSKRSSVSIDAEDDPFFVKKRQKNRSSKVFSPVLPEGSEVFRQIGEQFPSNLTEKHEIELCLLAQVKDILKIYISRSLGHQQLQVFILSKIHGSTEAINHTANGSSSIQDEIPQLSIAEHSNASAKHEHDASQILNPVKSIQFLEDDINDFGAWKILLSSDSMRHLRQFSKGDAHMFTIVRNKMKQLSEGFFSKSNQKRLVGKDTEVPVYEAKMTNDTRLVYTIDCVPDNSGEHATQVIRMFGVYTHAQINSRLWAAVASWSARRGAEHRRRCLFRQTSKQGGDYYVPGSWPPLPEVYTDDTKPEVDKDLMLELHALLTHEKFVTLTQTVLQGILTDEESTHPFSVSHREHEIIYHPSSCFVIGRSGTGKTTTMLFKMLGIERTSRRINTRKVRQVFITQSRVLAERVEEYFQNMIRSYSSDLQSSEELEWNAKKKKEADKDLVQLDEEYEGAGTLPEKFSELEDKHFPLFLTFDKLCRLLEADLNSDWNADRERHDLRSVRRFRLGDVPDVEIDLFNADEFVHHAPKSQVSSGKILFEDFSSKYWAHFSQPARKGLDASLVWSEFQGVLRGSEHSLECQNGAISREVYESNLISFRKQATFATHRSRLYDLFESYMKRKAERREYDAADRTHNLLRAMRDFRIDAPFDYIYVDEVQDNLVIDTKLVRMLCRNPHGLFWAGDTAQQITSTAFRFSDLKAFLHRIEETDPAVVTKKRPAIHPKSFTLSVNYRSHGGIVNCAHSVVQLLTSLWPDSIDALDREQGLVDGPKPVFFSGWDTNSVHYEQFLFGDASERVEFGAEQCILVRNEAAKDQLRSVIGDVGVVMTLYESKGLEFSDVLLYNFFQDSVVKSEWRVLLNAIEEKKRIGLSCPTFDPLRHQGVCSELKFLYVGLTRARNQLWIWDSSPEAEPMKLFWSSRDQIEIRRPGDDIPHLAVKSTPEEWEKMGRLLFARANYQQATVCFDRANMLLLRNISQAYHLRKQAKLIEVGTSARRAAFSEAARIFKECAEERDSQSQICWLRSAECFVEAGDHRAASDAFCEAEEYTRGAIFARKAGAFERAVEIVESHDVEPSVVANITSVCQIVFLRENKFRKARRLFESDEELLEQMEFLGFDKTPVLLDLKQYEEAADIQTRRGDTIRAIELYIQAATESAAEKAGPILLEELWCTLPAGASINDVTSSTLQKLLRLSESLKSQPTNWHDEVLMFQMLLSGDYPGLRDLATGFLRAGNAVAAIRCYYHLVNQDSGLRAYSFDEMHEFLRHLNEFGSRLGRILRLSDNELITHANTQKLLGCKLLTGSSQEVLLYPASCMNTQVSLNAPGRSNRASRTTDRGHYILPMESASFIARNLLRQTLQQFIRGHCWATEKATVFSRPCGLNFAGMCSNKDCQWLHVAPEDAKNTINRRLRLYLAQIIVISNGDFLFPKRDHADLRSRWISRLFEVVYPHNPEAGKLLDFAAPSTNLMVARGLSVLRDWIREGFYSLIPFYQRLTPGLFLLASAFDHHGAFHYIRRARITMDRLTLSDGYRTDPSTGQRHLVFLDLFHCLFSHEAFAADAGIAYIS